MAIASIIVSLVGLVLSFILGFPISMIVGPYVGLVVGAVGLVLAIVAHRNKKTNVSAAGLVISLIVIGICLVRAVSFGACVGRMAGFFSSVLM